MNPVLSVRGLEKRFGAVVAADALSLDIARRSEDQPDRRQRRRQDHLRQPSHRLSQARQRDDRARRPRHRTAVATNVGPARHLAVVSDSAIVRRTHGGRKSRRSDLRHRAPRMSFHAPAEAQGRRDTAVELLERFGLTESGRPPDLGTRRRRAQTDRHRHGAGAPAEIVAAGRADIRRIGKREIFDTMDRVIHAVAPDAATIVFIEHDMEIVSRYADRVVAFYQGRILG